MTDPKNAGVRTLGVKLAPEMHAQFVLVTQMDGLSLADGVLRAVAMYIETKSAEGDFTTRAAAALEEIEREAAARRDAIQGLLGRSGPAADAKTSRRRGGEASS